MLTDAAASQLTWNIADDVSQLFQYAFSRNAFAAGTVVALVAGAVGYFVVLRGLAFAAHALSHAGFAGAAGAVLVGLPPLSGLLLFTASGGAVMGALGHRIRERDMVVGIVLAWMLGLGALFLSLYSGHAIGLFGILFGQIYGVVTATLPATLLIGGATLLVLIAVYRPLLFASLDDDVAAARGVPVRALNIAFMVLLAVTVSNAVQVIGVLLIFALLVTPAAVAELVTARPGRGIALSMALALLFTWAGLFIAYYVPAPPSFFITTIGFLTYVVVRAARSLQQRRAFA